MQGRTTWGEFDDSRRLTPPRAGEPAARTAAPSPLLAPAAAFLLGVWAGGALGLQHLALRAAIAAAVALLLLLAALRHCRGRRDGPGIILIATCAALGCGWLRHQASLIVPAHHLSHHMQAIEADHVLTRLVGDVITVPRYTPPERRNPFIPFEPTGRIRFILAARAFRVGDELLPTAGRVRIAIAAEPVDVRLGERIELTGRLYLPRGPQNPGEPDWRRWNELQGIDAGMFVSEIACITFLGRDSTPATAVRRGLARFRAGVQGLLLEPFTDTSEQEARGLLDTLVLGQRSSASRRINEAFLRAGGMHFLAVSGFHVGVLAGGTYWFVAGLLRRRRATAAAAALATVLLYALVAEPNAPVLRATVMTALAAVALLSGRQVCVPNWLAAAAVLIVAILPNELFRAGFQFSFVLVLALLTIVPRCERYLLRRWRGEDAPAVRPEYLTYRAFFLYSVGRAICTTALVAVIAWLVALPLTLYHFGRLAPWGMLGSFLLAVPAILAIWCSFLALFLSGILGTLLAAIGLPAAGAALGEWLSFLPRVLADSLIYVAELFGKLPGSLIYVPQPPLWQMLLFYALLILLALEPPARLRWPVQLNLQAAVRRNLRLTTLAVLLVFSLGCGWSLVNSRRQARDCELHLFAVGDGAAHLLRAPDGAALLIDAGTMRNYDVGELLAASLAALRIRRLDAAFLTHANFDHYSGLPALLTNTRTSILHVTPFFAETARSTNSLRSLSETAAQAATALQALRLPGQLNSGGMRIDVLWPPADLPAREWSINDRSLVLRVHSHGRVILLTGDIERDAIRGLLAAEAAGQIRLDADVLVAPHHGSVVPETAALLAAVQPELILVSAEKRRPSFVTAVRNALGSDCPVHFTGESGALALYISPDGAMRLHTPFAGEH